MTSIIEQPRHSCTLAGLQTAAAIYKTIPIVHGGPGCAFKIFGGQAFFNGFQGSGYAGGNAVVGTNTREIDVVFGGEKRLKEVIEGSLKVMDGELFVVMTGCTADLVGDDSEQIVSEFREQGVPIVHASTGGFKGNSYLGHEIVVRSIISQLLKPAEKINSNLVNVWSVVPYQDTFWSGNLSGIKTLLEGIGLEVNVFFGHGSDGIREWEKISSAGLNIVVSPWTGLPIAKDLQKKFGTPYLHYPVFPIGAVESSKFLQEVGKAASVPQETVERYIQKQEAYFYHYIDRAADFFLEMRWDLPGKFINISDSFYSLGITRFLVNELSLIPGKQFITDDTPEEYREALISQFTNIKPKVSAEVVFSNDGGDIASQIKALTYDQPPLILGSSWDKDLSREMEGYHLAVSLPITDRLVLDRGYSGYKGGLRLIEDIYASILSSYQ